MPDTGDPPRGRSLLLVDDDEIFADTLSRALNRHDFEVSIETDVPSAAKRISAEVFDFAVIDLRIGDDTGLGLVEQLAAVAPDTRTVVLTGFGSIATAVEAIKLGATHYLTKPASMAEIVAALEQRTPAAVTEPRDRPLSVRRLEWEHIQKVLAEHDGNISATARALGMHRRTLQRKLQKHPVRD